MAAKKKDDKEIILKTLQNLSEGRFESVDTSLFEDQEIAEAFSKTVNTVGRRNTYFLMRINDSMQKVGDAEWLKNIFNIIEEQQNTLEKLQEVNTLYTTTLAQRDEAGIETMAVLHEINHSIVPCVDTLNEILSAADAFREGMSVTVEDIAKLRRLLAFSNKSLIMLVDKAGTACENIDKIYAKNAEGAELAKPIVDAVVDLTESFNKMSLRCFTAGRHMHEISRIVDEARNDMYRKNSAPTEHDRLEVFTADHIVVTWRMYNHIQEYETLKRRQVDDPDKCKLGLWLRNDAPDWLKQTEAFEYTYNAHEDLHLHLLKCFEAKENYDLSLAMEEFDKCLDCLNVLKTGIGELHKVLNENGYYNETPHDKEML